MAKKPLTITRLKQKVWKAFSLYIRLKDADALGYNYCYTCGARLHYKELQAGHGLGGRTNSILFDEELVKPQCKQCNIYKFGNQEVFHLKLIKEHGLKWFEDKLKLRDTSKKFTVEELQQLYEYYNGKLKKLLYKA
jgi:hypothetical protein